MKRALAILLLAAGTAFGQIDNPPSSVNIVDATATGRAVLTATNAAAAATAIGLGITNDVRFNTLQFDGSPTQPTNFSQLGLRATASGFGGFYSYYDGAFKFAFAAANLSNNIQDIIVFRTGSVQLATPLQFVGTNSTINAATTRTNLGLGATNNVTFNELTVKSLTTTDPVGWALDAVQTAAATNGVLTLPDAANVLRITNANAISSVTNGRLGAFYYLVNQTTNNLTISNAGGITVQGGTPLTLGANQAATLVATGPTNASVAARGNLTDVTLGGTANTAPNQTASSGSSLMTRDLSDARYGERTVLYLTNFVSVTNSTTLVDTPLSVALPVGNYLVRSALFAENAASAPGHAFQFGFTGSASPARLLGQYGSLSSGGLRMDFPLTFTRSVSNSFITVVNVEGYVRVTVTGTLTVKYAQQTATTNVSQLKEGFLEVIKLP